MAKRLLASGIPPVRPLFGRQEEFSSITNNLIQDQMVVLIGRDGYGKTAMASDIGHSFLSEGHSVLYVACNAVKTVDALAQAILDRIEDDHSHEDVPVEHLQLTAVQRLGKHLNTISTDTVFILDNVQNLICDDRQLMADDLLSAMLFMAKSNKSIKVLCTSSKSFDLPDGYSVTSVTLGPLGTDGAHTLMKQYLPDIQRSETERIGKLCNFMPLALHIFAAALQEDGTSAIDLIAELRSASPFWHQGAYHDPALFQAAYHSLRSLSSSDQKIYGFLGLVHNDFTADHVRVLSGTKTVEVVENAFENFLSRRLMDYDPVTDQYSQHELLFRFSTSIRVDFYLYDGRVLDVYEGFISESSTDEGM